jgi:hypothetical protein
LTEVLEKLKAALPFALAGIDTDNDTVFINETVKAYCEGNRIEVTRCRPYRKNNQAHAEQNGVEVAQNGGGPDLQVVRWGLDGCDECPQDRT